MAKKNQWKTFVRFYQKKDFHSDSPPHIAEAEVLIRHINIATREFRIIQFYSVNIILPEHHPAWDYWNAQSKSKAVVLPQSYWDTLICYEPGKGEIIRTIPKKETP